MLLTSVSDLCVPMNTAPFVMTVSEELAQKEPHLTLEFLLEVVAGFQQYSSALKQFCLAYLSPWLGNLSHTLCEATATEQEKVSLPLEIWPLTSENRMFAYHRCTLSLPHIQ